MDVFFSILAVFVFAIFVIQIFYIYLYYDEMFRYEVENPNDVITTGITPKSRFVAYGGGYYIVSFKRFTVDSTTGSTTVFQNIIYIIFRTYISNDCISTCRFKRVAILEILFPQKNNIAFHKLEITIYQHLNSLPFHKSILNLR